MSTGTWRRVSVLAALALSAFTFNTTENLPIGLLDLIAADLDVSLPAAGYLVTGYGLTVAVLSLPLAHLTRHLPRRHLLSAVLAALVLSTVVSITAASYPLLFAARLVTAVGQALFWAVMAPVGVGLFPPRFRGRIIAVLSVCGSLATVVGVPAGTWLGQHSRWQTPFLVVGALAIVAFTLIAVLLPTTSPQESHAAYASAPDARRFAVVLATTTLAVTGMFAGFTYVVEYLTAAAGFAHSSVSVLLFVFGCAGILGVALTGPLLDRLPRGSLLATVALQAVAMLGLYLFAAHPVVVIAMLVLFGFGAVPVFSATQAQILQVTPGRTEVGFAANSAAFNVGIGVGALLGGLVLTRFGVRAAFLAGGGVTLAALATLSTALLGDLRRPRAIAVEAAAPEPA